MDNQVSEIEQLLALAHADAEPVLADEALRKLVIFELEGERYALAGACVSEIVALGAICFVPGCPPSLDGVISVRGDILSVINLYTLLGKRTPQRRDGASLLLGHTRAMHSALRVGCVLDVTDVAESAIQSPLANLSAPMAQIVSGVVAWRGEPVIILDLERLFDDYLLRLA